MGRGLGVRIGQALRFTSPVVAFAVMGGSAVGSTLLPAPEQLVPNTVARISDVPIRTGTITRAEFQHALVLSAAAEGLRPVPRPDGREYERLVRVALIGLFETIWLKGQAAEMNIVVTPGQVRRERERIKEQSFKSVAEYRGFLREMRYTGRDVYERVELQLLSTWIQARIVDGTRSKSEEQEIFEQFVADYNERWRSRTVCAPAYVIERCSNGPA